MNQRLWGLLAAMVLSCIIFDAFAQQHNVGYYQKISETGNQTEYALVWSAYIPGAENEPPHPGEFVIPPDAGGGCPEGDCEAQGMGAREDGMDERITLEGTGYPQYIYRILNVTNGGGGGDGTLLPSRHIDSVCPPDYATTREDLERFARGPRADTLGDFSTGEQTLVLDDSEDLHACEVFNTMYWQLLHQEVQAFEAHEQEYAHDIAYYKTDSLSMHVGHTLSIRVQPAPM